MNPTITITFVLLLALAACHGPIGRNASDLSVKGDHSAVDNAHGPGMKPGDFGGGPAGGATGGPGGGYP
ncbi:hypothetical protein [Kozakia baliensis]|uniref:hypothetical protein n=1 Tax=Kozakia baliensis TaxID=153496 RepID=UPI0012450101|nr:hypothetical protein [Kozakia baliensis]